MAKQSIFKLASKDAKIKEMMEECYYDLENDNTVTDFISTNVITINLMLNGKVNGGIPIGKISMISAPSMLGKSFVAMSAIKNAQKRGMQIIIIDTEYAFSEKMATSLGVDVSKDKLFVFQDNSIEKLITFILNIFDGMTKEERKNVFVVMDSWGTLLTTKTIKDGLAGKDVVDMTDSKKKNKLANIILNTKATWFIINHVYDNIGGFGDALAIPGGRKIIYNSQCVVLGMTRAKEKEKDKETKEEFISGHIITAKTHKSRYSKEASKLKFRIKHNGGLDPYYGILDDSVDGGYVTQLEGKPKKYLRPHIKDDINVKEDELYNASFWKPVFMETDFKKYLEDKYTFNADSIILNDEKDLEDIFK